MLITPQGDNTKNAGDKEIDQQTARYSLKKDRKRVLEIILGASNDKVIKKVL